jgi:hypothetical protein
MHLLARNGKDHRLAWIGGTVLGLAFWVGLAALWWLRH